MCLDVSAYIGFSLSGLITFINAKIHHGRAYGIHLAFRMDIYFDRDTTCMFSKLLSKNSFTLVLDAEKLACA